LLSSLPNSCSRLALVAVAALAVAFTLSVAKADQDGRGFRVRLARSMDIVEGSERVLSLTILPKAGFVISKDGPVLVAAEPPDGLELRRRRLSRKDAADPRAEAPRFELRVRAPKAGSYSLPLAVRFWVCRKRACRPVSLQADVSVTVRAPSVDAGVPDGSAPR